MLRKRLLELTVLVIIIFVGCSSEPPEMRETVSPAPAFLVPPFHTEEYDRIYDNEFLDVIGNPLSTFSIDVDTASYANVRRFIRDSQLPPPDSVRIEELINYFPYDYPQPADQAPFHIWTEYSYCPWDTRHQLVHIGIQGRDLKLDQLPVSNLVFLIDVSGSMDQPDKLPLLKQAFRLLADQLREGDSISIVVYAAAAGVVLPPTDGSNSAQILEAVESLTPGGSTAGSEGILLAYEIAERCFAPTGNNRVILATDGDFNIGVTSDAELVRLIEEKRETGIFLTVLGFGTGNYKDSKMEQLADKGNGNYSYIDDILEAKKVLVEELGGTLLTIAKDVKIQVEFNPAKVRAYRLIGYENRLLRDEDFEDDQKDAGELGAGHSVTALYELIPAGSEEDVREQPPLRYQYGGVRKDAYKSGELMSVSVRYKSPNESESQLLTHTVEGSPVVLDSTSEEFRFASAVAEFGLLLRNSKFKGHARYEQVLQLARNAQGDDSEGYRAEFVKLVETAQLLSY